MEFQTIRKIPMETEFQTPSTMTLIMMEYKTINKKNVKNWEGGRTVRKKLLYNKRWKSPYNVCRLELEFMCVKSPSIIFIRDCSIQEEIYDDIYSHSNVLNSFQTFT